jgi:predicted permease
VSFIDGLRHRLHVLLRGDAYAREVERELRFHTELDALSRAAKDAETAARPSLGNVTYYREEVRRMTLLDWTDRIRQDLAYALRGLMRTPAFAVTVVATLGLGIGVNAAMFSFIDRLFIRPPAGVVAPEGALRLYMRSTRAITRSGNGVFGSWSYPRFVAVRDRLRDTVPIALYSPSGGTLMRVGSALDSVRRSYVNQEYFSVLGLRPRIGRFFGPDEARIESETPVAVISDDLWHRSFGGDAAVIGKTIELKSRRFTIIGVAPRAFTGVEINRVDIWIPVNCFGPETPYGPIWYRGTGNYFRAIARANSSALRTQLIGAGGAALRTAADDQRRDSTAILLTGPLAAARGPADNDAAVDVTARVGIVALIVLLIACANVANMLLLRASSRRREIAVRRALGVSTARLYSQIVTESILLGVASGTVALLFAFWAAGALRTLLLPTNHWATAAVDGRTALVTVGTAFIVGFVVGLFPAAMAAGVDLAAALKSGSTRARGRRATSVQSWLLVTQAALSVVLLVGAGLFVRSLQNVQSIDLGYDPDGMIVVTTYLQDEARAKAIGAELPAIASRLRAQPGVVAVGLTSSSPMSGWASGRLFQPGVDTATRVNTGMFRTTPGYFAAAGVRIVAGRDFNDDDRAGSMPVIVVSRQLGEKLWPSETPIGKCVIVSKPTNGCTTIVGVVEDVHMSSVIENTQTFFYLPIAQGSSNVPEALVARVTDAGASGAVRTLRTELLQIMPDQSDWSVRRMAQVLDRDIRPWRMGAILFSALGGLALIVAAIGIYGVVAYAMSQRTHEMGVRIALGARLIDILDLVVADALRVVVVGIVIGLVAAVLLGRVVASQLFGVVPSDASILIASVVTMCTLAAVASLIPGWRAARVDPVSSLRAD